MWVDGGCQSRNIWHGRRHYIDLLSTSRGLQSIMDKSEASVSKRVCTLPSSKSKRILSLDQFKQLGSPVINSVEYPHAHSRKLQTTPHKRISFSSNSLVLLVAKVYIYEQIASDNVEALLSEFEANVDARLFTSLPQKFKLYYESETVKTVLRLGCLQVAQFKGDVEAQAQLTRLVNSYPFFRVCMVLWARDKSVQHLQIFQPDFDILLGN